MLIIFFAADRKLPLASGFQLIGVHKIGIASPLELQAPLSIIYKRVEVLCSLAGSR